MKYLLVGRAKVIPPTPDFCAFALLLFHPTAARFSIFSKQIRLRWHSPSTHRPSSGIPRDYHAPDHLSPGNPLKERQQGTSPSTWCVRTGWEPARPGGDDRICQSRPGGSCSANEPCVSSSEFPRHQPCSLLPHPRWRTPTCRARGT